MNNTIIKKQLFNIKQCLTVCLLIMYSSFSYAQVYTCSGKIESIQQVYTGVVFLRSSEIYGNSDGRQICNLNEEWKSISPEVCASWVAKLMSIEARGVELKISYNDALSCSSQLPWGDASRPNHLN